MAHSLTMIATRCVKLGISEGVRNVLPETTATREAETNAKIVALLKTVLGELKHCKDEQQRIQFLVGLNLVMPPRMEEGDSKGWIRRITHALAVKRGERTAKYVEEWNPTQDADASQPGYAHQLVRIACGRFHAESSDSSSARGSGARRQAQVRGGSAPTSGYGSYEVYTACRQRQ